MGVGGAINGTHASSDILLKINKNDTNDFHFGLFW